jgi:hypothetical protein
LKVKIIAEEWVAAWETTTTNGLLELDSLAKQTSDPVPRTTVSIQMALTTRARPKTT